ncbi:protein translocase subunit SecD [Alloalcanivorax mobilis]|uniref:protein translocase subunit SecD n=1 Tax=Alloalcanivorax mobilis TaxID=2019569 RepID=UPI000B5B322A|nr:protein translocase subunit SecD [Alloalcanivorax mobilis]ASK33982.1 protein translocase subunit SecDF [Alcanivorax sp. N3-2A]|tara:strand:- start:21019 stop:23538 length:2520 start_codon:yes stop_codon:yes gene_type:complete
MKSLRIRALCYGLVILLGVLAALPNVLPTKLLQDLPSWYRNNTLTLGLDLQGGSHLLLQVQTKQLVRERTLQQARDLAEQLDQKGIRHGRALLDGDQARLVLRPGPDQDAAIQLAGAGARENGVTLFEVSRDTQGIRFAPSGALRQQLTQDAVSRSLEVVRRRIDETGVVEPLITRQGEDGVLVQLPGVTDPDRVKALLGRTARLTFHLVEARPGADTLSLPASDQSGRHYVVTAAPLLDGGHLTDARLAFDQASNAPVVNFRLDSEGARRFGEITSANVGRPFAVVLDDEVITAPVIRSPITAGRGQISGGFSSREAGDLALLLRAGALPAPLKVVEQRTVGPDLGRDAIRMGVSTGLLGAALVLLFMVGIYRRWGLIANTALVVNVALVLGVLGSLGATLTLPGIAGLILSVGMAVDANILINERIREESRRGSSAEGALQAGFQRAYATIVDSNITTLIAVGLLFMFGSGPIRGFAVTMGVGLVVSLFTSVSVTRLLMQWRLRRAGRAPLDIPGVAALQRDDDRPPIQFMRVKGLGVALSVLLSVASLIALVYPGVNQGIDFRGGTSVEVRAGATTAIETVRQGLAEQGLSDAAIQQFGDAGHYLVRLPASAAAAAQVDRVKSAVTTVAPQADFPKVDVVGPSVSGGFVQTSLLAVLLAGVGMFIYLRVRFKPYYAWAAVITLGLDLSKTLGFFVLTGVEFNLTAVAALLTLIGYSVNDKVVVFDRIRENHALNPDQPLETLINRSITQTLTRTVFTSTTTFLAIVPMALAGGQAVASFALPMLFGIVVGTTSSIYIAAPMVMMLGKRALSRERQEQQRIDNADPDDERALFARID